jgi:RAB protein geranylgeranyltransferase component A
MLLHFIAADAKYLKIGLKLEQLPNQSRAMQIPRSLAGNDHDFIIHIYPDNILAQFNLLTALTHTKIANL